MTSKLQVVNLEVRGGRRNADISIRLAEYLLVKPDVHRVGCENVWVRCGSRCLLSNVA